MYCACWSSLLSRKHHWSIEPQALDLRSRILLSRRPRAYCIASFVRLVYATYCFRHLYLVPCCDTSAPCSPLPHTAPSLILATGSKHAELRRLRDTTHWACMSVHYLLHRIPTYQDRKMSRLNGDLLLNIIGILSTKAEDSARYRASDLCALSQTCHYMRELCMPYLFGTCTVMVNSCLTLEKLPPSSVWPFIKCVDETYSISRQNADPTTCIGISAFPILDTTRSSVRSSRIASSTTPRARSSTL